MREFQRNRCDDAEGVRHPLRHRAELWQIFQDNCFRNHMLPLVLNLETVQHLGTLAASGADFLLDVERSALVAPDGREYRFALPSFRQTMLLRGEDEVAVTLRRADQISVYQQSAKARRPWEWPGVVQ